MYFYIYSIYIHIHIYTGGASVFSGYQESVRTRRGRFECRGRQQPGDNSLGLGGGRDRVNSLCTRLLGGAAFN